ncbi:hypothetical protein Cni_G18704 [Canna indica]|uniref:Uncharacterized protein n=1 Tax=Canna indica TaxID=4628 RepID=A0AAQ3KL64_9LILI|nr:hypothetical protein Cni_G18704 [Canna indica]
MGCFLVCFRRPKDRKRRRSQKRTLPLDLVYEEQSLLPSVASPEQITPDPLTPNLTPKKTALEVPADVKENLEQGSFKIIRKKVTFDLNAKIYEIVSAEDPKCLEDDKWNQVIDEQRNAHGSRHMPSPKLGAFPLNHRYQNCAVSDDDDIESGEDEEEEDSDFDEEDEDSDFDDEDYECIVAGNDELYDSLSSLATDERPQSLQEVNSSKPKCPFSPDKQHILLARGNRRNGSHFVRSVLTPVENLSQWKEIKVREVPVKNSRKENIGAEQENQMIFSEPMSKVVKSQGNIELDHHHNCSNKKEIFVVASLSNWLQASDNMTVEGASHSHRSDSSLDREERPILGAFSSCRSGGEFKGAPETFKYRYAEVDNSEGDAGQDSELQLNSFRIDGKSTRNWSCLSMQRFTPFVSLF